MSALFNSSPWSWPTVEAPAALVRAWRSDAGAAGWQWELKGNCSLTPRQMLCVFVTLCAVSLLIGAVFYLLGAPAVLPFAALELGCLGMALLWHVRHVADRELLTLGGGVLAVEHHCGPRVERSELPSAWLQVHTEAGPRALVALAGQGRRVLVGRYLRPQMRTLLARELRCALRAAPRAGGQDMT